MEANAVRYPVRRGVALIADFLMIHGSVIIMIEVIRECTSFLRCHKACSPFPFRDGTQAASLAAVTGMVMGPAVRTPR
ncbi:MAG: hypothetical protein JXB03_05820 [Spirochaetales bacterium]|nr:hypothetical protein [Spirochaetales bacterium]